MLLPFMTDKKKDGGSAASVKINDDGKINAPSSDNIGLESACQDLIHAVHSKDPKMMAQALRNAIDCMSK